MHSILNKDKVKLITDNLSDLIYSTLNCLANTQRHPDPGPDRMDENIMDLNELYYNLSELREQFELLSSDARPGRHINES